MIEDVIEDEWDRAQKAIHTEYVRDDLHWGLEDGVLDMKEETGVYFYEMPGKKPVFKPPFRVVTHPYNNLLPNGSEQHALTDITKDDIYILPLYIRRPSKQKKRINIGYRQQSTC